MMKMTEEYLREAAAKLGKRPSFNYVAVEALNMCLKDHCDEMDKVFAATDKIVAVAGEYQDMVKKIKKLMDELSGHAQGS